MKNPNAKLGLFLTGAGLVLWAAFHFVEQPVPSRTELREVTGALTKPIVAIDIGKRETIAWVKIDTGKGFEAGYVAHMCFLWKDCVIPDAVAQLKPGQVLTLSLRTFDDTVYVWELKADGAALVPFEAVAIANHAQRVRYALICGGMALLGLLILAAAGVRKYVRSRP